MSTDAILNQLSEPNVILTAHATKVNRTEPNWTEPQTCLACQNHATVTLVSGTYRPTQHTRIFMLSLSRCRSYRSREFGP